jgi:hypothetical protein
MPVLRRFAAWVSLKPVSSTMMAALALLLMAAAVGVAVVNQPIPAFALLIAASATTLLTKLLGQTGVPEPKAMTRLLDWRCLVLPAVLMSAAAYGFTGWKGQWATAIFALWLAVQMLITIHAARRGASLPLWRAGAPGEALVLLVAYAAGWPMIGLGLVLLHAVITQLWVQQKSLNA